MDTSNEKKIAEDNHFRRRNISRLIASVGVFRLFFGNKGPGELRRFLVIRFRPLNPTYVHDQT